MLWCYQCCGINKGVVALTIAGVKAANYLFQKCAQLSGYQEAAVARVLLYIGCYGIVQWLLWVYIYM